MTARGNRKQAILTDGRDGTLFLHLLEAVGLQCGWRCHSYCLMPNHYHLLVRISAPNLSVGIQRLNGFYAQSFNFHHEFSGHLFQGRFHSVQIERESHLLELARYVVLNPVRAGLCRSAGEWRWSSYRPTVGIASCPRSLDVGWLLAQFGRDEKSARSAFRRFVNEGLGPSP